MAARRRGTSPTAAAKQTKKTRNHEEKQEVKQMDTNDSKRLAEEHLPPLPLVFTVLVCSGFLLLFAMRDFMTTGRNIFGEADEAMMTFTKSTDWFVDTNGWKSTQGGFSAVKAATTDANNMGGFFVRKMCGAAGVGVHLQKLVPLLVHPQGAQWARGHFRPLLAVSILGNLSLAVFYALYWQDLAGAGASELPLLMMYALGVETLVITYYSLSTSSRGKQGPAVAMENGKTPSSPPSMIVSRTVMIVSSTLALVAGRDLFFPGFILGFIPRDDIYLEWTNAFRHSPPDGSPEAMDQGMEAPLYIGEKFAAQLMALHILILCVYKMVSAFGIRYGSDGRGEIQAKMIWLVQAAADAMMLFVIRVFTPAASSASLDLRWILMMVAYETFILGLYSIF